MRQITIAGRLGSDPETKTTKNNANYVTFRFANSEYGEKDKDGNQITYWYEVSIWNPTLQSFVKKSFKKGSGMLITGTFTENVYVDKNGTSQIGRRLTAHMIDFFNFSRDISEDTQSSQVEQVKTSSNEMPKVDKKPASAPTTSIPDEDDDLPF